MSRQSVWYQNGRQPIRRRRSLSIMDDPFPLSDGLRMREGRRRMAFVGLFWSPGMSRPDLFASSIYRSKLLSTGCRGDYSSIAIKI